MRLRVIAIMALVGGVSLTHVLPSSAQEVATATTPYATADVQLDPSEPVHGHPGRRMPYIHRALRDLGRARRALSAAPDQGPLRGRKAAIVRELDELVRTLEKSARMPLSKPEVGRPVGGAHPGEAHPELVRAHRNLERAVLALSKAPTSENLSGTRLKVLKKVRLLAAEVGKASLAN
ncbi:MAG: hypothetical protein VKO21_11790 [Candidatus Sericytochromatia bacterium]|nr:hypothetical protein [Candidatus Sericytochromatia bacterium]